MDYIDIPYFRGMSWIASSNSIYAAHVVLSCPLDACENQISELRSCYSINQKVNITFRY